MRNRTWKRFKGGSGAPCKLDNKQELRAYNRLLVRPGPAVNSNLSLDPLAILFSLVKALEEQFHVGMKTNDEEDGELWTQRSLRNHLVCRWRLLQDWFGG